MLQANTRHPCKAKVGKTKHDTPEPTFRGLKKEFCSNNHVPIKFWLCANGINRHVKGGKKKWVLDWLNLLSVWLMKVGTNLTWEEVLVVNFNNKRPSSYVVVWVQIPIFPSLDYNFVFKQIQTLNSPHGFLRWFIIIWQHHC